MFEKKAENKSAKGFRSTGSSNTNPAKVEAYYRDIEQVYFYF